MLRDPAAKRYAQAAFELAREKGELDVWERQFSELKTALDSPEAKAFLRSTRVPAAAKDQFFQAVLADPAPLVWNFLRLLAERQRTSLLPQITEVFQALADDERGIAHARVTTAVEMSSEERAAIARRLSDLTGKQVQVEAVEDPAILGGMVARIGDRLIDGSTHSKLIELKRQLAGSSR